MASRVAMLGLLDMFTRASLCIEIILLGLLGACALLINFNRIGTKAIFKRSQYLHVAIFMQALVALAITVLCFT